MSVPAPIVVADDLTCDYGPRRALDGVTFSIARGEVLGLLGPNGAGKSTCLRLLTGYLVPARGRASIAGYDVLADGFEARRRLGYVPEDALLYPHLTVNEFLRLFARLKGCRGGGVTTACDEVVARLALGDVRHLAIGKLSRGYRQRVTIAQALLGAPEFLIFDEPSHGLDPWQVIDLRELIRELATEHAVLVTSHVLSEIERVATRALILLKGRSCGIHAIDAARPGELELLFMRVTGGERA